MQLALVVLHCCQREYIRRTLSLRNTHPLLTNYQLDSNQRNINMAASNATVVLLCASCHSPGNMACVGCHLVTVSPFHDRNMSGTLADPQKYCNATCQKAHWKLHKTYCKSPLGQENWQPEWVQDRRMPTFASGVSQFGPEKWLWGNTPSIDVFQLDHNEGRTHNQDLNVLFAGTTISHQSCVVQLLTCI